MTSLTTKRQRCDQVNQAIRIIAAHGRRFFYCQSKDTYASMEVDDNGRIWFVDDYSQKRIYTHRPSYARWRGFNHGGTLRRLVELFRDYIRTGKQLHPGYLGQERLNDSNIWGYEPEAMAAVRAEAGALPVFRQPIWRSERGSVDADEVEAAIDRVRLGLEPEEDGEYDQ